MGTTFGRTPGKVAGDRPETVGKLLSAGDDDYWQSPYTSLRISENDDESALRGRFCLRWPDEGHSWHADTWANFIRKVATSIAGAPGG